MVTIHVTVPYTVPYTEIRNDVKEDTWDTFNLGYICVIIGAIVTIVFFGVCIFNNNVPNNKNCITADCNRTALRFKYIMKSNADPCENFDEYTCGRCNDSMMASACEMYSQDKVTKTIEAYLKSNKTANGPKILKEAQKLYDSCINLGKLMSV